MKSNIPADTLLSIKLYVRDGLRPGHFLTNVFEGDLFKACARADVESKAVFFDIVEFIEQECPVGCYGSREAVDKWMSSYNKQHREVATAVRLWLQK